MKTHIILFVALVLLLVLAGVVLAQSGPPRQPHQWYSMEQATLVGRNYNLVSRVWQFDTQASGGDYRLQSLNTPDLRGNGCCCTFLPCQWHNSP